MENRMSIDLDLERRNFEASGICTKSMFENVMWDQWQFKYVPLVREKKICDNAIKINDRFLGWKAAKATPEGFVLELEKGRFVQYELIDLLTRSLSSSKVLKTNTNWVHVVRMLNVGSTVAHRICEKLGVDPESTKFEAQEQSHD